MSDGYTAAGSARCECGSPVWVTRECMDESGHVYVNYVVNHKHYGVVGRGLVHRLLAGVRYSWGRPRLSG